MATANEQVIEAFCAAWARRDVEEILGFFTDDAVYHNIPMEPAVGIDAIRAVIEMFVPPADEIAFTVHNVASAGDVVFNERTDRFVTGGTSIALPVAGVFEVRDGKITAWRDYFDLQSWITQST
jgi:limonene-1,2-epoxide hydrolase